MKIVRVVAAVIKSINDALPIYEDSKSSCCDYKSS